MRTKLNLSPLLIGCMKLGTWGANLTGAELERFIDGCLDLGLVDFDHADIYGGYTTEQQFGDVIRHRPELKNKVRITTKCGIAYPADARPAFKIKHYNLSADYIRTSINTSLRNLGVDQLHVFLLHRPDVLLHPSEVAEVIAEAKSVGKIRHFGVSNFTPSQVELLHAAVPIETNQVQASIAHLAPFTDGTFDQLLRLGITPTAWSPLGGGKLFGGDDLQTVRIRQVAASLCETHRCSLDQLLFAWLMRHPAGIISVTGTSKLERVQAALEATEIKLTHEEWYQLWTASTGEKVA